MLGWISTDEDEIKRRHWRGRTEIDHVLPVDADHHPFGDYRVTSSSGRSYVVEMRSLNERIFQMVEGLPGMVKVGERPCRQVFR